LDKPRLIAITKCDLMDDELTKMISGELPKHWDVVFISSVAQTGLTELRDQLWRKLHL